MKAVWKIAISLFLLIAAHPAGANSLDKKMMDNLDKRCDEGLAAACFDYGKALVARRKKAETRRAQSYFRRACKLAYQPACQKVSEQVESKIVKGVRPKFDNHGNPCNGASPARNAHYSLNGRKVASVAKGSLWDQAGFQPNDEIISVNGEDYKNRRQIGARLHEGGAVVNVLRNGRPTSLMIRCP